MASCLTPGGRRCPVRGASDSIEPAGGYDLSKLQASSVTSTRTRRRTSTSTGAGGSVGEIPTERHRQRGTPESASGRVRLQRHRHLPGAAGCRCNLRTCRPCLAVLLSRSGADRTVQPDRVQRRRVSGEDRFHPGQPRVGDAMHAGDGGQRGRDWPIVRSLSGHRRLQDAGGEVTGALA